MHAYTCVHAYYVDADIVRSFTGGTKNRGGHIHLDTGPEKLSVVVFDAKCTCDSFF